MAKANSFDTKYKKNIEGLAKANNVDMGTASAMLKSNLNGKSNYKGGGVLDFKVAGADLKSYLNSDEGKGIKPPKEEKVIQEKPIDLSGVVTDVQRAYEAKQKAMEGNLVTQLADIKTNSDDDRSQAYVNSRLSAIGNNEKLANQGLAGNLYADPTSGKSETSRIAENVALGNNVNAVNRQETALTNQAKAIVASGLADNQLEMAKVIAEMKMRNAEIAKADLANEKAEYASTVGQYGADYKAEMNRIANDGDPSNDWKLGYLGTAREGKIADQATAKAKAEQQAFDNQIKLYNATKKTGGSGGYSGLSASQAQTAYNNGSRTPQVMEAMAHWYGITDSGSALTKPTITAPEAKKASEDGISTPAVEYAMLYYYDKGNSDAYSELVQKISGMSQDGVRSWIQYYNQNGKIDDVEAKYLLQKYGIL